MKKSKLRKTISHFFLLVYFTIQAIAFDGLVLCQGNDGHVAIEFANGGHCTDLPVENPESHKHSSSSEHSVIQCELNHCGDCEDIPLTFVSAKEGLHKSITPLKPSVKQAVPPFFAIYNQQKQFATAPLQRLSPFNSFPSILRTTVLLI